MDEIYDTKSTESNDILEKINPLYTVLGNELITTLIHERDILLLNVEDKKKIKKAFKEWCHRNHPDKLCDSNVDNSFIIREYGEVFLR